MVDDEVRNGRRIAQLLSSELTALETGPLADVGVVDVDPDATPTPGGTFAYAVAVGDGRLATVSITEGTARIAFAGGVSEAEIECASDGEGLSVDDGEGFSVNDGEDEPVLVVERGAAVKRAVDALEAVLE